MSWQKWSFVVGFNVREGLTLHDVRYENRPILFRAAFGDIVIPYGDPQNAHRRKNAFDVGEYGVGLCAIPLVKGEDTPGDAHFFHGDLVSSRGSEWKIENAVAMYEEDFGVLWKHFDRHSGSTEIRRSRRLVVTMYCAVENYDYGFSWHFFQDGTIEFKSTLTGFLSLGNWGPRKPYPKYGNLVAPGLYAPNHQHIFNVRLDFAVDGIRNNVSQVDVVPEELGPENPFQNGFYTKKTLYRTEKESRSHMNVETSRTWEIASAEKTSVLGIPTAYRLIPKDNMLPIALGKFWHPRARFVDYHVQVSPFKDEEYWSAGKFPNQQIESQGIMKWAEQDRNVENGDCVLWYTFGVTHIPRPEDYPVMPAAYSGFLLKPYGFFDKNPGSDVPPQREVNGAKCH